MEELDLKEIMQVFWEKKLQIIIILSISIIIGCIYTLNYVTPMYKSSTTLILGRINSSDETQTVIKDNQQITQSELSINASLVSTYSKLIKSESLIKEVKHNLNIDISEGELRKSITVKRVDDTELIEITVSNVNPGLASEVANEIAKVFGNKVEEIYKISNVYIIDRANPEPTPYNINHVKDIMIFLFVGIIVSTIYVVLYNLLDTTIKSSSDIEKLTNLKNLISIPLTKNDKSELITYEDSKSVVSEAFRTLRTNVQFSSINDKKTKSYLVTSCFQSEGKSYISSNLAITFAQAGKKVILIDSDMRRGRQSKIFNFPNEIGLSNYISNIAPDGSEINYDITRYIKETGITNLNIITSGNVPPNPSELLASPKVPELIKELKEYYDIIIFDGAPVLPITDSLILTRLLDSTLLVARYNQTKKDDISKAKSDLENVGGKIIGTCLNAVTVNSNSGDLNYYYYYGERDEKTLKERINQFFGNIKKAIKKLGKLKKINKSSKQIKIIEEIQSQNKKVVEKDVKKEEDIVKTVISEVGEISSSNQTLVNNNYNISPELKKQQEKMLEDERKLEEIRRQEALKQEQEKIQEELRKQEELKFEKEKKQEELKKQEQLKKEEERKQAELKKQEKLRIEEEKRKEKLKIEEERRQERLRIEEENKQAELKRKEEEEKRKEEERKQREEEQKRKEEERKLKEEEKRKKAEERKKKIEDSINKLKNNYEESKNKMKKKIEDNKIKKAEKKIKMMEEQAKLVKEKLQKAEEERDKMFGKRIMFEIDGDEIEDVVDIQKLNKNENNKEKATIGDSNKK